MKCLTHLVMPHLWKLHDGIDKILEKNFAKLWIDVIRLILLEKAIFAC